MPILAYNKTIAPLALAAGSPIVTLPASLSAGARGPAYNVTAQIKGLSPANYALLQVQVAAGSVEYEWTTQPEYNTDTLVTGSAARDIVEGDYFIYINSATGDDNNPGTLTLPVATYKKAKSLGSVVYKQAIRFIFDADGTPRDYVDTVGKPDYWPTAEGPLASPPVLVGARRTIQASQAETVGGSVNVLNGVLNNTTLSAGITAVALIIPVVSTAGFPDFGVILIDSEYIQYSSKTPTQFNVTAVSNRGFTPFPDPNNNVAHLAAAVVLNVQNGYWVDITSGANSGQRVQVKNNTATTLSLLTDLPAPIALGDTYIVQGAGTSLDLVSNWWPSGQIIGVQDLILNMGAAPTDDFALTFNTMTIMQGVEILLQGFDDFFLSYSNNQFRAGRQSDFWSNDPGSLFSPLADQAGIRCEGQGFVDFMYGFCDFANISMLGISVTLENQASVKGGQFGSSGSTLLCMQGGEIFCEEGSELGLKGSSTNPLVFDGCRIRLLRNSTGYFQNIDISNSLYSGVTVDTNAFLEIGSGVTGSGNTLYGLLVGTGNVVADPTTTLTGVSGDMKVGNLVTRTWANFAAGVGGPVQNEYDILGTGAHVQGPSPASYPDTPVTIFPVYTVGTRPAAASVPAGYTIWESDALILVTSDGTLNWYDQSGAIA